jgi:hypothetical protein
LLAIKLWFNDVCFCLSVALTVLNFNLRNWLQLSNSETIKQALSKGVDTEVVNTEVKNNEISLIDLKAYYELTNTINQWDYSRRIYNFQRSLESNIYFTTSGSNYLDILLVSLRKPKRCALPNLYQLSTSKGYSILDIIPSNSGDTYYSKLPLSALSIGDTYTSTVKTNSINNTLHSSKTDRWSAKNRIPDRGLTTVNTSYKLANLLISESNLRNNFSNENLWISNFYNNNNLDLMNFNNAQFNTFFYKNLSTLSQSRVFFQKRWDSLNLNQISSFSFFLKYKHYVKSSSWGHCNYQNIDILTFFTKSYLNNYTLHGYNHLNTVQCNKVYKVMNDAGYYPLNRLNNSTPVSYISYFQAYTNFSTSIKFFFKKKVQKTYF